MTLNDQCGTLVTELNQLGQITQLASQSRTLHTRDRKLQEALERIAPAFAAYRAMTDAGVPVDAPRELAQALHRALRQRYQAFLKDRQTILEPEGLNEIVVGMERLAVQFDSVVKQAWRDYTEAEQAVVDDRLLSILRPIPGFEATVTRIHERRAQLARLRASLPDAAGQVRRYQTLVQEIRQEWEGLHVDSLPDEVRTFITRAASTGANLDLLTPIVLQWLQERGLMGSFNVLPRDR